MRPCPNTHSADTFDHPSKTLAANMGKRKLSIDSDDCVNVSLPITRDLAAELEHVQDEIPTSWKFLTPLLESIRQAYEAAAPRPKIPVKVRN